MTDRGQRTIERLIASTRQVIKEYGYANTTTRRIAEAAGVTEGTIYRHFPGKRALLVAAVVHENPQVVAELSALPNRAGQGSVQENLTRALSRLATLREDILPLELAMLTEPDLIEDRLETPDEMPAAMSDVPRPADFLGQYLKAEQRHGRVDIDVDAQAASMMLLALLFGLSVTPQSAARLGAGADIETAVGIVVRGLLPRSRPDA